MNASQTLRTITAVVVWSTVAVGVTMAFVWFARGGTRAYGPEDQLLADAGASVRPARPVTSFSLAQIGGHVLLGLGAAALTTYVVVRDDDRTTGYLAAAGALLLAAVPWAFMFRKWWMRLHPRLPEGRGPTRTERVEDHIPRVVAFGHGMAAAATVAALLVLAIVD